MFNGHGSSSHVSSLPMSITPYPASRRGWAHTVKSLALLLVAVVALGSVLAFSIGALGNGSAEEERTMALPRPLAVERVAPLMLLVPEEVRKSLGILIGNQDTAAVAALPTVSRPLVLPGSTALDPARLVRVRARFAPAKVLEIGTRHDLAPDGSKSEPRKLRSGDQVQKGELLAVVDSVEVAAKKNDLVDSLVQLRLDEDLLERHEQALKTGSTTEVGLLTARRNVQADRNAISRALNALKIWEIPDKDIQEVYREAEESSKRQGKRDPEKARDWGRVELRASMDGTIVEWNANVGDTVVDNTMNLFQIAQVDRLAVIAYLPEEDVPTVLKLEPHRKFWTIRTVGAPSSAGIRGPIEDIGYLIDPNMHTAIVKGHIDNPNGELRGTQYITATIQLPPPKDVVEVPASAVVDDGRQTLVFVQPDAARPEYQLRRVEVTQRFDKTVFVRSKLAADQAALTAEERARHLLPRQPLWPGERVLTAGVLELKKELEDREGEAAVTNSARPG